MDADKLEDLRFSMASYYEKKRWDAAAEPVVEAEVKQAWYEYHAATMPYDIEGRVEAILNHFHEASNRWEPGRPAVQASRSTEA
jgi:hypothetical protein